jgi:ABC-type multidrug transport system fused ATPase/permease subunit
MASKSKTRQRRKVARSILILACLGSALGESRIVEPPKKPPPPPPRGAIRPGSSFSGPNLDQRHPLPARLEPPVGFPLPPKRDFGATFGRRDEENTPPLLPPPPPKRIDQSSRQTLPPLPPARRSDDLGSITRPDKKRETSTNHESSSILNGLSPSAEKQIVRPIEESSGKTVTFRLDNDTTEQPNAKREDSWQRPPPPRTSSFERSTPSTKQTLPPMRLQKDGSKSDEKEQTVSPDVDSKIELTAHRFGSEPGDINHATADFPSSSLLSDESERHVPPSGVTVPRRQPIDTQESISVGWSTNQQTFSPPSERWDLQPPPSGAASTSDPRHLDPQQQRRMNYSQRPHDRPGQGEPGAGPPPQYYSRPGPSTQYRGPPPRQQYGPPQPQPQAKSASTWKALWGKVEKGLDGLASFEDALTGRAQNLVSSVTPVPLRRSAEQGPKSPRPSQTTASHRPVKPKDAKKSSILEPTTAAFTPFGNKYAVAKEKEALKKKALTAGKQKMISANGGASEPNGQLPRTPPISQPPPPQQQQSTPNQHGPSTNSRAGPVGTNPYVQPNIVQTSLPTEKREQQRRDSRIPWDTKPSSVPAGRRPQARPPQKSFIFDEDEKPNWKSRLAKMMPPIPSPLKLFRFKKGQNFQYANLDAWNDDDEDEKKSGGGFLGLFGRRKQDAGGLKHNSSWKRAKNIEALAPPLASIISRCENGKTTCLTTESEDRRGRSIGRLQATFDMASMMFLLLGMQQMVDVRAMLLSASFKDLFSLTLPELSPVVNSLNTWAPFLFACAYLTTCTSKLLVDPKIHSLANSVGGSVQEEAQYGQLYLRLVASLPMNAKLPEKIREAAYAQVSSLVSSSRLRSFVTFVLSLLVIMTVSVLRPVIGAIGTSLSKIVFLEQLRTWPVPWSELGSIVQGILKSLSLKLESLIAKGFSDFLDNPIRFAFHLSIFLSLMTVSFLPHMEERRKVSALDEEEEDTTSFPLESAGLLSKLGVSSASRLSLLSDNGSVENALERWQMTAALIPKEEPEGISLSSLFRIAGYRLLGGTMILAPLVVSYFVGRSPVESASHAGLHWNSVLDVSVILAFVFGLVCNAMDDVVSSMGFRPAIAGFLSVLSTTVEEVMSSNRGLADMQFQASITPNAGITVRDLWAAHTTKRAWAVRGASLQCKNGEILVLLGDDGAGKTRLLTTLAESMVFPPKRSLSSNKVRGSIHLSGVDVSKWDRSLLKRRVGILLSDVRTAADTANFVSGSTLEEILEPMDGQRIIDPSHKLSASERSAMILALKV